MFAGMTMRAFARPNLSPKARVYIDVLLKVMATVSDNIIYLLVGFALTIEIPYVLRPDLPGNTLSLHESQNAFIYVIVLCLAARAFHLFPIIGLSNFFSIDRPKVPFTQQIVCWFSGLRGAIAVALAYQVVGPNAHVIRASTMFVVVGTTFVFGGSTKCLLDTLKIPTGCEEEDENAEPAKPGTILARVTDVLVDRRDGDFEELKDPHSPIHSA